MMEALEKLRENINLATGTGLDAWLKQFVPFFKEYCRVLAKAKNFRVIIVPCQSLRKESEVEDGRARRTLLCLQQVASLLAQLHIEMPKSTQR
jgi:hypothetical protein